MAWSWESPSRVWSGTADGDVAPGGVRADLDGLLGLLRSRGEVVQLVAHPPVPGLQVEPRGGAPGDPDLHVAGRGAQRDRVAHDPADADGAVGGLDVGPGVGPVDGDVAVGRAHPQLAGDGAQDGLAVGVLDHRGAVDLADLDPTAAGGDLRVPGDRVDGDATHGAQVQRAGPVEPEVPDRRPEPALPQPAGAVEVPGRQVPVDLRAGGELDQHVDRPGLL